MTTNLLGSIVHWLGPHGIESGPVVAVAVGPTGRFLVLIATETGLQQLDASDVALGPGPGTSY